MAKGDDIEERLVDFGVRIIKLNDKLPRYGAIVHLKNQLLRSGTAPAAHYAEARGAESDRDFIHKLKIALKELNESRIWLRMMMRSGLVDENRLELLYKENDELCLIINSSIKRIKQKQ